MMELFITCEYCKKKYPVKYPSELRKKHCNITCYRLNMTRKKTKCGKCNTPISTENAYKYRGQLDNLCKKCRCRANADSKTASRAIKAASREIREINTGLEGINRNSRSGFVKYYAKNKIAFELDHGQKYSLDVANRVFSTINALRFHPDDIYIHEPDRCCL
jgi:hypothetical protein